MAHLVRVQIPLATPNEYWTYGTTKRVNVSPCTNLAQSIAKQYEMPRESNSMMNWYVYIIECRDDKLYTGITTNVEQRIKEHNSGKGCRFTKFRGPVKLLYKKKFSDRKEAGRKEREIKGLSRA